MKTLGTFAFLIVLASCGGSSPPGPRPPEESEEQRHSRATEQKQADDQRDLIRSQDVAHREAEAKRLGLPDEPDGGKAPSAAVALAQETRAKAAAAEQNRKLCEPSQVARATEAQTYAKAWTSWLARVAPHRGAIKTSCTVRDAKSGDFDCKNLPKGVSKEDALRVLRFDSDWARANDPGYLARETVVPKEAHGASVNGQCAPYDALSDLDTQVTLGNTAGIEKLQKWKPKPP